jgi:hypothetical protein
MEMVTKSRRHDEELRAKVFLDNINHVRVVRHVGALELKNKANNLDRNVLDVQVVLASLADNIDKIGFEHLSSGSASLLIEPALCKKVKGIAADERLDDTMEVVANGAQAINVQVEGLGEDGN